MREANYPILCSINGTLTRIMRKGICYLTPIMRIFGFIQKIGGKSFVGIEIFGRHKVWRLANTVCSSTPMSKLSDISIFSISHHLYIRNGMIVMREVQNVYLQLYAPLYITILFHLPFQRGIFQWNSALIKTRLISLETYVEIDYWRTQDQNLRIQDSRI